MLVHTKIIFDHFYCIKAQCDTRKHKYFEETALVNLYFLWLKSSGKGMFTANTLL